MVTAIGLVLATICATIGWVGRGNEARVGHEEWRWASLVGLALVVASVGPYLIAWIVTPEGAHFTGLILNPQDGNSYIAKMRQGLFGSWSFHLPYTSEPHDGAPVYLFYLFLGHVARWTGLPLILLYHAARVLGGLAMLLALYALASWLGEEVAERRVALLLAALGSGLGWLVAFLGHESSDLWVPEAFPAYALLANAHFPLAMALMVWIADCGLRIAHGPNSHWLRGPGMALAALLLGVIQPFGLVAVFGGLGVMILARAVRERAVPWRAVMWVAISVAAVLPYPLYMLRAIRIDPVLAAWDAQNVTTSPPLWDWALSYGLVLVLAVLGTIFAARRGSDVDWLLLGWALVTFVGMYLPLPLQRRLSLGLGIPLGLLAGVGWWRGLRPRIRARRRGLAQGLVVAFCALTPVFLVLMVLMAALAGAPWFFLSEGEWAALRWLRDRGRPDAVVLCAPQMGLFVPAWAGQPVVYGHPFETVEAERRRAQVESFWAGEMGPEEQEAFLQEGRVGYVLIGPRETEIGGRRLEIGELVLEADDVRVYDVQR